MVSKVAVIALVAVIAVPIFLGYAFNLTETTETDYRTTGDPVNVSSMLQSGTEYTTVKGDPYQLNTNFRAFSYAKILPFYESVVSTRTNFPIDLYTTSWPATGTQQLAGVNKYYIAPDYDHTAGSINFIVYDDYVNLLEVNNFETLYYDATTHQISYSYYSGGSMANRTFTNEDMTHITFSNSGDIGGSASTLVGVVYDDNSRNPYVDIAAGYHFENDGNNWWIVPPSGTYEMTMTINLDSITASDYTLYLSGFSSHYALTKTTTGGVATWTFSNVWDSTAEVTTLYTDPNRNDNTYQIITSGSIYHDEDTGYYYNQDDRLINYIGGWPTIIGKATPFITYERHDIGLEDPDYEPVTEDPGINRLYYVTQSLWSDSGISPTIRIDDCIFRGVQYQVIQDREYNPAAFKTNPATTIGDPFIYGSSFDFGGVTYNVSKDGKITLDGHKIPVKGLVLSSTPNEGGGYDNKIGNTLISNTAQPSTITFNGKWSVDVTTIAQESYTITKTKWVAGSFAWDGIDQNFLIVGLITCLGVFIGCGIYARKSRSGGIIPLMIITGCAAFVFFIML